MIPRLIHPVFYERQRGRWPFRLTGPVVVNLGMGHLGHIAFYERDEMLEFEQGVICRTWVRLNGQAEPDAAKPQGYAAGSRTVFARKPPLGLPGTAGSMDGEQK
jgi:hypothetical protein